MKPIAQRQGRGVRLRRTSEVRWVDPFSWPAADPRWGQAMLAQRFIDTGPFTENHRVGVVLGRAVFAMAATWRFARPSIDLGGSDPVDVAIASNAAERRIELSFATDVIDCACRAARAFPDIPVLGVDVVREATSGNLYILEVNAAGYTWFSANYYEELLKKKHGLDLANQFGALPVIADALIEATRRAAE